MAYDPTRLFYWRSLSQTLHIQNKGEFVNSENWDEAMQWLASAASKRGMDKQIIARLLEDDAISQIAFTLNYITKNNGGNIPTNIIGMMALQKLVPLLKSELLDVLDPLLRRSVGTLAQVDRNGCLDSVINVEIEGQFHEIIVPEEEDEKHSMIVLLRAVSGDKEFIQLINSTNIIFEYSFTSNIQLQNGDMIRVTKQVSCSLITLLWNDHPQLRTFLAKLLIGIVASIDPPLACFIIKIEANLQSDDTETRRRAHTDLVIELLQSGFFEIQRDIIHAIWRFRQCETNQIRKFLGWIGGEDAKTLCEYPTTNGLFQIGPLAATEGYFYGMSLFKEHRIDLDFLLGISTVRDELMTNIEPKKLTDIEEWFRNRVLIVESNNDSLKAAWALRQLLLGYNIIQNDISLIVNEQSISLADWFKNLFENAFGNETSEKKQFLVKRGQLMSHVMHLAAYACSGPKNLEQLTQSQDFLIEWIDQVLLMNSKLYSVLIDLNGGIDGALEATTHAVYVHDISNHRPQVFDYFDPFIFGDDGDNLEQALTLMAMLLSSRQLLDEGRKPTWWTDKVRVLIETLVVDTLANPVQPVNELSNKVGLIAPLRVKVIAQQLLELMRKS